MWRTRLAVAVGLVCIAAGAVVFFTAPEPSAHFHDNPSSGDLSYGAGVLLVVFGIGLLLSAAVERNKRSASDD